MTVSGIDVSRHQGPINWQLVAQAGHTFAFCKATDGISYPYVGYYRDQIPRIKAAGLVPGAYHWLQPGNDPAAQARYFLSVIGNPAGLLCALDVERGPKGEIATSAQAHAFADEFRRQTGGHPLIVYTGQWYWVGVLHNPHGADIGPLWHSEYETTVGEVADGPELDKYGGWNRCLFWQFTSTGQVSGVVGNCDVDLFYGDRSQLLVLAAAPPTPPTPPPPLEEDDDMHKPYILAHPAGPHYYVCGPLVVFLTNGQTRVDYQDAKFDFVTVDSETDAAAILEAHRNWPLAPPAPPVDEPAPE